MISIHKTAGRILTMSLRTTMTIEVQILIAPDISVSNEVINLSYRADTPSRVLSAASFLAADSSNASLNIVLGFICKTIENKIPSYEVWLFISSSTWQSDTRVVRYRGLWGALKLRGVDVPGGVNSQEILVEQGGRLKFYGAQYLPDFSIKSVANAVLSERCSYIVVLPKNVDIQSSLKVGWTGDASEDLEFINCICDKGGLVFKKVGEFDDREWGFVCIGFPEALEIILD